MAAPTDDHSRAAGSAGAADSAIGGPSAFTNMTTTSASNEPSTEAKHSTSEDDAFLSEDDGEWKVHRGSWEDMYQFTDRKWRTTTSSHIIKVIKENGRYNTECDAALINCLKPRNLRLLSKIRAIQEGSSVQIPCKFSWPRGYCSPLTVRVKFRDGVQWVLKLEDPDVTEDSWDPYPLDDRTATHIFLNRRLGPVIPKIIDAPFEAGEDFGFPHMLMEHRQGVPLKSLMRQHRDKNISRTMARDLEGKIINCLGHLAQLTAKLGSKTYNRIGVLNFDCCPRHPFVAGSEQGYLWEDHTYTTFNHMLHHVFHDEWIRRRMALRETGRSFVRYRMHDSDRDIVRTLLTYANSEQSSGRETFVPRLTFGPLEARRISVNPRNGRITGLFGVRPPSVRPRFLSVYNYPEFLQTDWIHCNYQRVRPQNAAIRTVTQEMRDARAKLNEQNALGQTLLESIAYFQTVWRHCIRHYETTTARLSVGAIRQLVPSRRFVDGLQEMGCFTCEQLIEILNTDDKWMWDNIVSMFVKHEKAAQSIAGVGPFEPDTSSPGLFLTHFDKLFYHKSESTTSSKHDDGMESSSGDESCDSNDGASDGDAEDSDDSEYGKTKPSSDKRHRSTE